MNFCEFFNNLLDEISWSDFNINIQEQIQELAENIHKLLFIPNYEVPLKTLDLPIGGKILTNEGIALVYDTIIITNELEKVKLENQLSDVTGELTISYLKNCRNIIRRISSIHPGSLGLHPVVYFYSLSCFYRYGF